LLFYSLYLCFRFDILWCAYLCVSVPWAPGTLNTKIIITKKAKANTYALSLEPPPPRVVGSHATMWPCAHGGYFGFASSRGRLPCRHMASCPWSRSCSSSSRGALPCRHMAPHLWPCSGSTSLKGRLPYCHVALRPCLCSGAASPRGRLPPCHVTLWPHT
jgi:hypothetical protein